jgi:DNA-binding Lrp family transcriptional regulator
MTEAILDHTELKLLSLLQSGFPLSPEPYHELGVILGISGRQVINKISDLKVRGIVRQISPVLDARRLGYYSSLVAMQVAADYIDRAESYLISHPGISHAYERGHDFNIWITFAIPPDRDMQSALQELADKTGASAIFDLPALRVFKLRTNFGADIDELYANSILPVVTATQRESLSPLDRRVINSLQSDLPLSANPFYPLACGLGLDVATLLGHCHSLLHRGIIRRYGASVNHYRAGYTANAMTCWTVPPALVEDTGKRLASFRQVSHCYERKTNALWRHNLFAMVHGQTKEICSRVVDKIRSETGLPDQVVLFSTREIKKTRMRYLV